MPFDAVTYILAKKAAGSGSGSGMTQIGRFLSTWDSTTGLPSSNPQTMPYNYITGDFYLVGVVGDTNYQPDGTTYTGDASTTVDTRDIKVNDMYFFDGTGWLLLETVNPDLNNYYTKTDLENRILPDVTSADAGKFALVNDDGEWVAQAIPTYNGGSY